MIYAKNPRRWPINMPTAVPGKLPSDPIECVKSFKCDNNIPLLSPRQI